MDIKQSKQRNSPAASAILTYFSILLSVLVLSACGGGGGGGNQSPDPVVVDLPIAYVKRPLPLDNQDAPDQLDARELITFNEGGDLYIRDRAAGSAAETNITGALTGGLGDVKGVEASYDGTMLVFSLRLEDPNPNDDIIPTWNIYVYEFASGNLKRIVTADNVAEQGDDISPHFLPDNRIVFTSTRQRTTKALTLDENFTNSINRPQFSAQEESRNEHAFVLHVMNIDCSSYDTCDVSSASDINQISFNQSHDMEPTVLMNGKILYTRWDNMGGRNAMHLYQINPDGTENKMVYGAHSHDTGTNNAVIQFLRPRETATGAVTSIMRPFTGTFYGGDIMALDINTFAENTVPTWNNIGTIGNGQITVTNNNVTTDGSISEGGRYSSAYPLFDGTNRLLVSWSPCRLEDQDPNTDLILACTAQNLADPNLVEGRPLYGLYVFDPAQSTQLPIFLAEENFVFTDLVVAEDRTGSGNRPDVIFDKVAGIDPEIDQDRFNEGVGVLHIRSVYDFDGTFNNLGATDPDATSVANMANPTLVTPDQRPARFLKVVKGVGMPDEDTHDFRNTAFGVSAQQLMREIVGYAPIEPDGSVIMKVPANVPLAISLLDQNGRRISVRHQSWFQVRAGETVTCNGCHDHNSGLPHGHSEEPVSVNNGAPTTGIPWPGTDTMDAEFQETMAQTRMRLSCLSSNCDSIQPSLDINYTDVWNTVPQAADINFNYRDLTTVMPAHLQNCVDSTTANKWQGTCRTIINYETHIHPIWSFNRGVNTCTNCHHNTAQVPAGQLDLSDGQSDIEPDHFKSYRELMSADNSQVDQGGTIVDEQVPLIVNGMVVCQLDGQGQPIPDPNNPGQCLPVLVTVTVNASMSPAGANASAGFFNKFTAGAPGDTHTGYLTDAELKLISEWLDVGAQYYNDPFAAPLN